MIKKIISIGILGILLLFLFKNNFNKDSVPIAPPVTTDGIAFVDNYYIYGRHFNLTGSLPIDYNITAVNLTIGQQKFPLTYEIKNQILSFSTSDLINKGVLLDDLQIGSYNLLVEITTSEKTYLYKLNNKTNYNNLEYYTITKNKKNNYIEINIDNSTLTVSNKNLPADYYDISIDPGHGGVDFGAVLNTTYEKNINLQYSLLLKSSLEQLGLKVKLTRDTDLLLENYGKNSRISSMYESHAKYNLSIHCNKNVYKNIKGLELYTAPNIDYEFISLLSQNIQNVVGINCSNNNDFKVKDCIYTKTLTTDVIEEMNEDAKRNGYVPYNIKKNTAYYFMIREAGGIATNAYVDGRDKQEEENIYRNSNIGLESYLIELGYMSNTNDYQLLTTKKASYIDAITKTVKKFLNL